MTKRCQLCIDLLTLCISGLTLGVLIYTAYYVKEYWKETQIMKEQMIGQTKEMINQTKISSHMNEQMITQTKISSQTLKASLLPLLDVSIEFVSHFTADFAYDIYLHNKGNGPAFNITVLQTITKRNRLRPTSRGNLKGFSKKIPIIGKDERTKIHTEHSDSYDYFKIKAMYRNPFGELQHCVFEGNRDGLKLKEHPMLKHFQNDKSDNSEPS